MSGEGNADTKRGEKKMDGDDSVRTVECLRGRLLAERVASRNAKAEAEQWENKLTELENLLKQEAKSRNRADKKLKFLIKKLQSMNISYVSDEPEYSALVDKSDISSISSTTSSTNKQQQENLENQQTKISKVFETQDQSKGYAISQKESETLQQNDSKNCFFSLSDDSSTAEGSSVSAFEANLSEPKGQECETRPDEEPRSPTVSEVFGRSFSQNATFEDSLSSATEEHSEKSSSKGQECETGRDEDPSSPTVSEIFEQNIAQNATFEDSLSSATEEHSEKSSSKMDHQSDICYDSFKFSTDEDPNEENDQDHHNQIDNSMALVVVDAPQKNRTIDPEVLDATVKDVLDALRYAKEQLQSSMDRRRANMIRVG